MKAEPTPQKTNSAPAINQELIEDTLLHLRVCIVTSSQPAVLTKTRKYNAKADTIESESGGFIVKGYAENVELNSMRDFAQLLDTAETNQALIAAIHTAKTKRVKLYSTTEFEKEGRPADSITRTKDYFKRPVQQAGLLILDCDDKDKTKAQFFDAVRKVLPQLDEIAWAYKDSSSAFLYANDQLKQGEAGKRLYIVLANAEDTARAGANLFDRLWLAGYGKYEIGAAGQFLNRGIIDVAMFGECDTARLDFIGGSHCIEPVTQKRPPAEYNEGRPLDSLNDLPKLKPAEKGRLDAIQASAKAMLEGKAKAVKEAYCERKGLENLAKQGKFNPTDEQLDEAKNNVLKALDGGDLTGEFVITLAKDKQQITVAELLADPDKYDQAETLDPIEPSYHNYAPKGKLYLSDNRPTLHSFAHGGKTYRLYKQSRFILHSNGSTTETTNNTLQLMRAIPTFYDMGGQLVTVKGGHVVPMGEHLLTYELGSIAQYYYEKTDKDGVTTRCNMDPPKEVVKQILSMGAKVGGDRTQRGLKPLKAVITAPTITADNHIVYKRGYDETTQLYLDTKEDIPRPVERPTQADLKAAHDLLMSIIDTFKLKESIDKSVVLSA